MVIGKYNGMRVNHFSSISFWHDSGCFVRMDFLPCSADSSWLSRLFFSYYFSTLSSN